MLLIVGVNNGGFEHTAFVVLATAELVPVTGVLFVLTSCEAVRFVAGETASGCGFVEVEVEVEPVLRVGDWTCERLGDPALCFCWFSVLRKELFLVPVVEATVDVEVVAGVAFSASITAPVGGDGTIGGIGWSSSRATSGAHRPVAVLRSLCRLSYSRNRKAKFSNTGPHNYGCYREDWQNRIPRDENTR